MSSRVFCTGEIWQRKAIAGAERVMRCSDWPPRMTRRVVSMPDMTVALKLATATLMVGTPVGFQFEDDLEIDPLVFDAPGDFLAPLDGFPEMGPEATTAFDIWRQLGCPSDARLSALMGVSVNMIKTWRT